jgi:hypothetical protein
MVIRVDTANNIGTIKISTMSAKAARIPKKYRDAHEPEQVLGHELFEHPDIIDTSFILRYVYIPKGVSRHLPVQTN